MTVRTIAEILKDADKQMPDASAFGASDTALAAAILAQAVDRHAETLADAIKHTGDFTATLKIHPEVTATLKITVAAA